MQRSLAIHGDEEYSLRWSMLITEGEFPYNRNE